MKKYIIFIGIIFQLSILNTPIRAELSLSYVQETGLAVSTGNVSTYALSSIQMLPLIAPTSNTQSSLAFTPFLENNAESTENVSLRLDKPLLNYPNPFSFSSGSTTVGYSLTKDAPVDLTLYSLTGFKLYSANYPSGTEGGTQGYNRIAIDKTDLYPAILSPGVYLVVLTSDGTLLGKDKWVVLP